MKSLQKLFLTIFPAFLLTLFAFKVQAQQDMLSPLVPPEFQQQLEQIQLQAQNEHIQSYDATIVVNKDGSINVSEKIRAFAKGDQIKRGIFRDFPTVTKTKWGKEVKPIQIVSVLKNGKQEPYFTEKINDGFRLYIGEQNVFLPTNTYYDYEINYVAQDQVRYFDEHDEIYWNVTGNFWSFEIKNATAKVVLPFSTKQSLIKTESFYGPLGSTAKGAQANVVTTPKNEGVEVTFKHNQPLQPKAGLTVLVGFPKGLVDAPTKGEQNVRIYASIAQVVISIILFLIALLVMFSLWHKFGRDTGGLSSIPVNFEPPQGASPLEVRYINKMGRADPLYLSLVVLGLAIKGYLKVVDQGSKVYSAVRTKKDSTDLQGIEQRIYNSMFPYEIAQNYDPDQIVTELTQKKSFADRLSSIFTAEAEPIGVFTFNKANRAKVLALQAFVDSELSTLKKKFIVSNSGIIARFLLLDVVFIVVYFMVQLSLYTLIIRGPIEYFGTFLTPDLVNIAGYAFIALIPILSIVFSIVMPRRTLNAREMQDKIEGFKMFLKSQEHYLKAVHDDIPSKFNMYEKYLPYAIALDLEPVWSAKFKDVVAEMSKIDPNNQSGTWYVGRGGVRDFGNFSPSSFSSAIASSMVTTSSGSGSSGFSGGSSGGGGGGGGGGGW